jgi:hypothetical protein
MPAVSSSRTRLLTHSETFDIASDIPKTRNICIHPSRLFYAQHRQHNNRKTTGIEHKSCSPHVANVCRAFQVCRRQHIEEKGELFRWIHLNFTKYNTVHKHICTEVCSCKKMFWLFYSPVCQSDQPSSFVNKKYDSISKFKKSTSKDVFLLHGLKSMLHY